MVFDDFARKIGEDCGKQGCQTAEEYVVHTIERDEVCEYAAHVQRGYGFGEKERQNGEGFGGTNLERSVRKRAERPGDNRVQRGDYARPAQHFGVPMRKIARNAFEKCFHFVLQTTAQYPCHICTKKRDGKQNRPAKILGLYSPSVFL